jgi:hypothetical protein
MLCISGGGGITFGSNDGPITGAFWTLKIKYNNGKYMIKPS